MKDRMGKIDHIKHIIEDRVAFLYRKVRSYRFKLTPKSIFVLSTGILIAGIGIVLLSKNNGARAAWFDNTFSYRQRVPITNAGSAQTNFQVGMTLNTSSLITAGKMQSDCDDIRVVQEDGTVLPHWVQEQTGACNSTTTKIWTKIPTIPTTDMNVYIYYGNTSATNVEDGKRVFEVFDKFDGSGLSSVWTTKTHSSNTGASYNIAGGTISFTTTTTGGFMWLHTTTPVSGQVWSEINVRSHSAVVNSGAVFRTGQVTGINFQASSNNVFPGYLVDEYTNSYRLLGDTTSGGISGSTAATSNTSGIWRFSWPATGSQLFYVNDSLTVTGTNATIPYAANKYLYLGAPVNATTGTVSVDWFFVRKYAATPPAVGTFGSEEISPGPLAYWKFDEGYGSTTNESLQGTSGTISGATWATRNMCITGSCLQFDGTNDLVDTGKDYSWSQSESFSISTWVNMKRSANATILGKGTTGSTYEYSMRVSGTSPVFTYWDTLGGGAINVSSSKALALNKWHHMEVVYDGAASTAYMYLDGVLTRTQTGITGTFQNRSNNLQIGGAYWNSGAAGYFPGFIDETKVYSYARSATEVKSDFAKGAASKGAAAVLGADNQSVLSDGLVGYWKVDESTQATCSVAGALWDSCDSSGNLNPGIWNLGVRATGGKFGRGLSLDGTNDHVEIGDNSHLMRPGNDMTASFWVKYDTLPTGSNYATAVMKVHASSPFEAYDISYSAATQKFGFYWVNSSGTGYTATSASTVTTGTWYHVVGVKRGDSIQLYVNNVPGTSVATTGTIYPATGAFLIGSDSGSSATDGIIDEVRVYNRGFTPREVTQLYEWSAPPLLHWDLNENVGSTAFDKTPGGYNGALGSGTQAPVWSPGQYGSGLQFDGSDDRVNLPDPSDGELDFEDGRDFTISLWVNRPDYTTARVPLAKKQSNTANAGYMLDIFASDNLGIYVADGTDEHLTSTDEDVPFNTWTYISVVYKDDDVIEVYFNGIKQEMTVSGAAGIDALSSIDSLASTQAFRLGSESDGDLPYQGFIDDLKVYGYALNSKQIIADMNASHPSVGSPVGSPALHYKLDEGYGSITNNSGNVGSSLNGRFGAGNSAPSWTNSGKFGKALSFDGTGDFVGTTTATWINFGQTSPYSVSAWVKPGVVSATRTIIGKQQNVTNDYIFRLDLNSSGKYEFAAAKQNVGGNTIASNTSAAAGRWAHLVGVSDGSNNLAFYVDGQLQGTTTQSFTTAANSTAPLYIGQLYNNTQRFNGVIDEVKIYNYALNVDEVKVEYNQAKGITLGSNTTGLGGTSPSNSFDRAYCPPGDTSTCSAPVGEWLMNEGVGGTAYDTSENSNNAIFQSGTAAPTWSTGIMGGALRLDGVHDHVEVGDPSSGVLDPGTGDFTLSTWIKLSPNIPSARATIIEKGATTLTTNGYWLYYQDNASADILFVLGDGTDRLTVDTDVTTIADDKWHHIVAVADRDGNGSIYIDGQLSVAEDISSDVAGTYSSSQTFTIGSNNGNSLDNSFAGMIDTVRYYNYARTPAQIAWEYSKGAPVAWYKMDECEGTTIYNSAPRFDDTAPGMNGTLTIGASGTNTSVGTCATSGAWADGSTGKRGASLDFDGTDDTILIGTTQWARRVEGMNGITMSAWFKAAAFPANDARGRIMNSYMSTTATGFLLGLLDDSGMIQVGGRSSDSDTFQFVTCNFGTLNQWTHAIGVLDFANDHIRIYVNGKLCAQQSISFASNTYTLGTTPPVESIASDKNAGELFKGQLDDLRIYNYPVTSQQARSIYNNGAVRFD